MSKGLKIAEVISSRTEYKRKFGLWEMYRSLIMIPGAAAKMIGNSKRKLISKHFIERLQLAVTEVNGCAACSYLYGIKARHE